MTQAGAALEFCDALLRADRAVVLAAVRADGWALEFAAPELQDDEEVVLAAVQQEGQALQMVRVLQFGNKSIICSAYGIGLNFDHNLFRSVSKLKR